MNPKKFQIDVASFFFFFMISYKQWWGQKIIFKSSVRKPNK
jgi:hypothetical protein